MKLTSIPEKLPYQRREKSTLSLLHGSIIDYAINHSDGTNSFKRQIIKAINTASYLVLTGSTIPKTNVAGYIIAQSNGLMDDEIRDNIGALYIDLRNIEWDIADVCAPAVKLEPVPVKDVVEKAAIMQTSSSTSVEPTPKEALYVKTPSIPQLDTKDCWLNVSNGQFSYMIPKTLPIVPLTQSDISVTTDVKLMLDKDLANLYPNTLIRTRNSAMYEQIDGIPYDEDLGSIIPIEGFSVDDVRDNIIKYPHIFQIKKVIDGSIKGFYSTIEINEVLYDILEVWDSLPESKVIPKKTEWIKEYIVRRYLLERDVKGIEHKFPMFGSLMPFLTLFAPYQKYASWGFTDMQSLARSCVESRVEYKRSRNPVIHAWDTGTYCNQNFCPFSGHCIKPECTTACPDYGEIAYLLERNEIPPNSTVYNRSQKVISDAKHVLDQAKDKLVYISSVHVKETSDLLTYLAICDKWQGSCFHCCVYHLDFYRYLERVQRSWGLQSRPDELEYEQIWLETAELLVISNFDFIQFKDFQAQTMLNIIGNRSNRGHTTILVGPDIRALVGANNSMFFSRMKDMMGKAVIKP